MMFNCTVSYKMTGTFCQKAAFLLFPFNFVSVQFSLTAKMLRTSEYHITTNGTNKYIIQSIIIYEKS